MDNKYKFLFKNTMLLTIGSFSSKILVFLMVPLYTNVLTTEEYGIYDLLMSTIQLIIPILTLNIVDGVMRFCMEKNIEKKDVISIGMKYILLSSIVVLLLLLGNTYFGVWNEITNFSIYVLLYYVSWLIYQLTIQVAKALERVKEISIAGVVSTIITIAFNLLFLLVFDWRLDGFFLAYILGQAIPALYLGINLKLVSYIGFKVNRKLEREMLHYSVPLIITNLTWSINSVSDRYIVTWLCGVAVNGIYSVSYKIPTIITTVQSVFTQAWAISAIKEYGDNDRDSFYQKTFSYLNTVMCVGSALLIFMTKPIAHLLYAKDFFEAWKYVPFLVVSCVINSASGYIGQILAAKKDTRTMAIASAYGAVVNVVLNIVLIYFIGAQGAAIATAISSFVIFLRRKKSLNEVLILKGYATVLVSWIILSLQGVLLICVQNMWLQIPFVGAMIYLYRRDVLNILNKILKVIKK